MGKSKPKTLKMNNYLKIELEKEYGDLLQQLENNFDWLEISKLTAKLNAINCLLETPLIESKNLYNILKINKCQKKEI